MPGPLSWRRLMALVLTPTLVAGGGLLATWNLAERYDRVEAAIVNEDEMVVIDDRPIPLGRQLAAELTGSDREDNFRWVLADEKTARSGLESGRYAAVVTIPPDFSAAATSMMDEPLDARRATITVETSSRAGISEATVGRTLADASVTALNQDLVRVHLDNVFLGFSTMHDQLGKAAEGAHQIATGQDALGEGLSQASDGASALAGGVGHLVGNHPQLAEGGSQLAAGSDQLSAGLAELNDAVRGLPSSADELNSGAQDLALAGGQAAGAGASLADGSISIESGSRLVASGAADLDVGVQRFTGGTTTYVTHANELIRAAAGAGASLAPLVDQVTTLVNAMTSGTRVLANQSGPVFDGVSSTLGAGEELATATTQVIGQVTEARRSVEDLSSGAMELPCPASLRDTAGACDAFAQGVRAGSGAASEPLEKVDVGVAVSLAGGFTAASRGVRTGLGQVEKGIATLAGQAATAQGQWDAARDQVSLPAAGDAADLDRLLGAGDELLAAAPVLAEGSSQLVLGAGGLVEGAAELAQGTGALADGLDRLADGADAVADGIGNLSTAAPALARGVGEAAYGGAELAEGVGRYTQGITAYTDGVSQVGAGADELADGLAEARTGTDELTDGSTQLADALGEAVDEVPNYSQQERDSLTTVAAAPIRVFGGDGLTRGVTGVTALLVIAALWLGTLAAARAIPRDAVARSNAGGSRLLARVVGPALGVGGVLGAVFGLLGGLHLGLHPERVVGLTGLTVLAGCAFGAVNQALVQWWGSSGRLGSCLLWALPSIMVVTRTAEGLIDPLTPVSPASPGLDVVGAWATGQPVLGAALALAAWSLAGLGLVQAWVHRGRTTTVRAVARRAA